MIILKIPTADENRIVKRGREGKRRGLLKNCSFLPRKCASVPTLLSMIVANN